MVRYTELGTTHGRNGRCLSWPRNKCETPRISAINSEPGRSHRSPVRQRGFEPFTPAQHVVLGPQDLRGPRRQISEVLRLPRSDTHRASAIVMTTGSPAEWCAPDRVPPRVAMRAYPAKAKNNRPADCSISPCHRRGRSTTIGPAVMTTTATTPASILPGRRPRSPGSATPTSEPRDSSPLSGRPRPPPPRRWAWSARGTPDGQCHRRAGTRVLPTTKLQPRGNPRTGRAVPGRRRRYRRDRWVTAAAWPMMSRCSTRRPRRRPGRSADRNQRGGGAEDHEHPGADHRASPITTASPVPTGVEAWLNAPAAYRPENQVAHVGDTAGQRELTGLGTTMPTPRAVSMVPLTKTCRRVFCGNAGAVIFSNTWLSRNRTGPSRPVPAPVAGILPT